ncbi:MAG: hypothetical protein AAF802_06640 [Planctomycetota bacterium]
MAKTESEIWKDISREYQKHHPGPFRLDDVVEFALANGMADLPTVDPKAILKKRFSEAMRRMRMNDPQGRRVRTMLVAKVPSGLVDENGNLLFDLKYDHIHTMSVDHALNAFEQRDNNITKQRKSATRDLESFLENNPNAIGHEYQFEFDFMKEGDEEQVVETISETGPSPGKPR